MSDAKEAVEKRTDEAFARSVWRDPRAEYRSLLRRLREQDSASFEQAVGEYESRVAARLTDAGVDPVEAWLDYGLRLAAIAGRGRTILIDEDGRARDDVRAAPAAPALLLHLPADDGAPAFVVAAPREPSAAQHATVALLAEGATALR